MRGVDWCEYGPAVRRLVVAAMAVVLLAGCGGTSKADSGGSVTTVTVAPTHTTPTGPKVFTVKGYIDVGAFIAQGFGHKGRPCEARSGYEDIGLGTAVVISDPSGEKVAVGQLDTATFSDPATCRFRFAIPDVPDTYQLYSIAVGRRGELTKSRADLNGVVALSLS